MKPLLKELALFVLLIGTFAFSSIEDSSAKKVSNLQDVNVSEIISKQNSSERPIDYQFFVETSLIEKQRGAKTINAKVYLLEKKTGKSAIISNETIVVPNFKDIVLLESELNSNKKLINGDRIIDSKATFSLTELIDSEAIYNNYINSTNELLDIKRSI